MSDNKRKRSDLDNDDEEITLCDYKIRSILREFRAQIYEPHTKTLTRTLTGLSTIPTEVQKLYMSYAKSLFTKHIRSLISENSTFFYNQTDQRESCFKDLSSILGGYMKNDAARDRSMPSYAKSYAKSILISRSRSLIDEYSICFQNQTQIDSCFKDVASICMKNVYECEKEGVVIGKLIFEYNGDSIDCMKVGIEGKTIPSNISRVEILKNYIPDFILLVEKDAVYMSLAKDKYYDRFNCIIVKAGKGLSGHATRLFLRKICMKFNCNMPVFALVDSYCYGLKVLFDYALTTPRLKWLGFRPSDFDKYKIPEECRWLMTEEDIKTTEDLLKEDFVMKNAAWVEELNLMLKMKQKVVLQALTTLDFDYLSKLYVPWKLQEQDWL
ncbi:DNA topoisomerase VI, subunit A [Artemisia annua]|uniref:DNA topoisomerase VI, subunit A n=1 Tax=Artemisia annua TaxID=35608 RepID=A0A2U1PY99_ARTAN|nr:DNA topoisomerase VI, subunit A [Artemisia annua]